jgi:DNA mismatch repair protein MutS2
MFALRALEFDRIVEAVASLALTSLGKTRLEALEPSDDPDIVLQALEATSETTAFLDANALFPLRAGAGLEEALSALSVEGRALEPLPLRTLADFLESVELTRAAVIAAAGAFPVLRGEVSRLSTFAGEFAAVRRAIDPSGEILDSASPALRTIREKLRQKRQRLRGTLEEFVRGREAAKYLQEQVITERNGRYVLLVRAEHRGNVPGIVHGSSSSGASLFMEPAATVELNNDIVELGEREAEETARILLELTDAFRRRLDDIEQSVDVASGLDVLQAKARFGSLVNGTRPVVANDGSLELRAARHPLLIEAVVSRLGEEAAVGPAISETAETPAARTPARDLPAPVPVDVVLPQPTHVLLITGPNTGGKTVALKTAGLLALMAQAGLHVPAAVVRLPVFRSVFADIGDEQSIAASLSTFSAHITNIVAMDRDLATPALVLLDEVGTGTDPNEGGALATAIVSHFRHRGALVIATTHYDALKSWGASTDGVVMAAFAFDPRTYAPTYRLVYGAPGRSLAIEVAQRLGLPLAVVAQARGFLSEDQKRLAAHLERVDAQARALEADRARLQRDKRASDEASRTLAARERALAEREERFSKRLNERLDDRVRQARRDIDEVIAHLKTRAEDLIDQALAGRRTSGVSTGDAGAARAQARAAVDRIAEALREPGGLSDSPTRAEAVQEGAVEAPTEPAVGASVTVASLGMEGTIVSIQGSQVEIDVRGKRLRTRLKDVRVTRRAPQPAHQAPAKVRVSVDLQPREGLLSELNVIGCTVDEAVDRVARFLDDTLITDIREVRIVHGHGTGQLRRGLQAFLKEHPLVQRFYLASEKQGGGGATIVELKE